MIARLLTMLLFFTTTLSGATVALSLCEDPVVKEKAKVPIVALHPNAPTFSLYQEPIPRWVAILSVPEASQSTLIHGNDVQVLLIDKQVNIDSDTTYYHVAKKVLSQVGIHKHALVELTFDPSYQKLTIHALRLRRGDKYLDRASTSDVYLMQTSPNEDPLIHNTRWSIVTLIEDIREGDTIEYSYTIKGKHPSHMDRALDECVFRYPYPVERIYYRVIGDQSRQVYSKAHNTTLELICHDLGGGDWEYVWNAVGVPGSIPEDGQPAWHQEAAWVQISEFNDWADVSRWGNSLFLPPKHLPIQLQLLTKKWLHQHTSDETRALAALHYVQDDISCIKEDTQELHFPSDLEIIIGNKAACHMDKAYLLVTLLRLMNIDAIPAAVSHNYRQSVGQWVPSPTPFDRVVVRVRINGNTFWIDPTASCQGGSLDQGGCAVYQRALLFDGISRELTCLGCVPTQPDIVSTTTYYLWPDRLESSILVETQVRGETANRLRRTLHDEGPTNTQRILWSNYVKMHGDVSSVSPTDIQDHREENVIVITEHYRAKNMWQIGQHGRIKSFAIYPVHIMARLPSLPDSIRRTPFALDYPTHIVETIHIVTPGHDWTKSDIAKQIVTQAMDCDITRQTHGDTLTLQAEMRILSDHILPKDIQKLRSAILKTKKTLAIEGDLPTSFHRQWDITFPFLVNAYLLLIIGFLAIDLRKPRD